MKINSFCFLILLCLFACFNVQAQNNIIKSLERDVPGNGKVTIHQDSRLESKIGVERINDNGIEKPSVIKAIGFRIQVYSGNNSRDARNEAYGVATQVKTYFPDLSVYSYFVSPRWLCRVGDFKSIEEADVMMRKLKATGVFREVSIVKEQINITL